MVFTSIVMVKVIRVVTIRIGISCNKGLKVIYASVAAVARSAGITSHCMAQVASPAGPLPALKPPGANDRFEYRMDAIPAVGEHNDRILAELGFGAAEKEALRAMVKSLP